MEGEVVGINSAKLASTEVEGMGYAIAISDVTDILQNLMNETSRDKLDDSEHGVLGIVGSSVSSEAVQMYGIPAGVFVSKVTEGGAADKAGLKSNSVITEFNGKTVSSINQLIEYLSYYEPGEEVELTVQVPDGTSYKEDTVKVTLDENTDVGKDSDSKDSKEKTKRILKTIPMKIQWKISETRMIRNQMIQMRAIIHLSNISRVRDSSDKTNPKDRTIEE